MEEGTAEKRFGAAVKEGRIEKGLSQEALSFATSLHRTYISSVERGCRNISLNNIVSISHALEMSASELLKKAGL